MLGENIKFDIFPSFLDRQLTTYTPKQRMLMGESYTLIGIDSNARLEFIHRGKHEIVVFF